MSAAYLSVVALLSLLPSSTFEEIPPLIPYMDLAVHSIMYGIMAAILLWSFPARTTAVTRHLVMILFFCAGYGLLMELLQGIFSQLNRSFSWADIVANVTGSLIVLVISRRDQSTQA
jgi:VanZ family protein